MGAILENAKRFRNQTGGLSRAGKIQWFGTNLGIDETELLRLMGYTPAQIAKRNAQGATFTELAEAKPERTLWLSELLLELADRSGYDLATMTNRLQKSATTPEDAKRKSGSKNGARSAGTMLKEIQLGGPNVLRSLTDYLSSVRTA